MDDPLIFNAARHTRTDCPIDVQGSWLRYMSVIAPAMLPDSSPYASPLSVLKALTYGPHLVIVWHSAVTTVPSWRIAPAATWIATYTARVSSDAVSILIWRLGVQRRVKLFGSARYRGGRTCGEALMISTLLAPPVRLWGHGWVPELHGKPDPVWHSGAYKSLAPAHGLVRRMFLSVVPFGDTGALIDAEMSTLRPTHVSYIKNRAVPDSSRRAHRGTLDAPASKNSVSMVIVPQVRSILMESRCALRVSGHVIVKRRYWTPGNTSTFKKDSGRSLQALRVEMLLQIWAPHDGTVDPRLEGSATYTLTTEEKGGNHVLPCRYCTYPLAASSGYYLDQKSLFQRPSLQSNPFDKESNHRGTEASCSSGATRS
ncbi:hypothetical protein BOTBODRAFT_623303 [Botryobasidium botryosum FD-172 SS1]|uniref:Uncharacterized protein n=1 Tax=Botryobasidium botryosum (strain FD-172 SS1) TaxID=930990 RepID=A0A067MWU5_BOTB1|nr:hypothetical protein BOTBODRAFT_623303 [Botryobasidium botryosum FD-172 SS1]